MTKEEMDKYAYSLMIKNNSDEAIKKLLFFDKEIDRLNNIINELEKYLEDNWKNTQDIWYVKIINKLKELKELKNE